MNQTVVLGLIVGLSIGSFLLDQILAWLNIAKPRQDIDPRVAGAIDRERYTRSLAYQKDKTSFGFWQAGVALLVNIGLLLGGVFGKLDDWLRGFAPSALPRALLFFAIVYLTMDLLSIPFQLYHTFRLEARYGFNRTTKATFIGDKLKGLLLTALLGAAAISGLVGLVSSLGPNFWVVFSLIAIAFSLFMNMFYTTLIVPLFNKLKPLPEGDLKQAITAFAASQDFTLSGILVMDASKRSAKSNAYFSGIGPKKKIVLFDTLIEKHSIPELVAVLAHELGHYKHRHIVKGFLAAALQICLTLWLFSLFAGAPLLSAALGASAYSLHLNVLAFSLLFSPISTLTGLVSLMLSRHHEYQADSFAARTASAKDMAAALVRLSADNMAYLYPHPAFVFFNYSHPPLLKRLDNLAETARLSKQAN